MPKTVVNGLWMGSTFLDLLETLTLKSFVDHGAEFHLWTYDKIKNKLPPGVVLRDGNELIPAERIFRYPENMLLGFGGGSYVGFSEIFRYKVLYEVGGWWSDMDVACLRPLEEVEDPYWFRFHGVLSIVGNIMKCPPKSELMRRCLKRALEEVNEHQIDWHHAIRILCYNVEALGLQRFIHSNQCNLDRLENVNPMIRGSAEECPLPDEWRFVHWMNSVINRNFAAGSTLEALLRRHGCMPNRMML